MTDRPDSTPPLTLVHNGHVHKERGGGGHRGGRKERAGERKGAAGTGAAAKPPRVIEVSFSKLELDTILSVYGRKVAAGEWRDYAIDAHREVAIFSVFRRASELPLYRIEKRPRLARRQGAYAVVAASGLVLKRGHELAQVLRIFEKRFLRLVEA